MSEGWIAVDFDGTLAVYDSWEGPFKYGAIVEPMKARILNWLAQGIEVRIFTARVSDPDPKLNQQVAVAIQAHLVANGIPPLRVTNVKDYEMLSLYDDRAIQVEKNTGVLVGYDTRKGH